MPLIENTLVYLDTENGNTVDGSGIVTTGTGAKLDPYPTMLYEPESTNFFLNSDSPVTQNIIVPAGSYVIWMDDSDGLGTITLSGDAAGVVTAATPLQFSSTGANINYAVAGANNIRVQLELGNYPTSYIQTGGSAVTRSADEISIPVVIGTNFKQEAGICLFRFILGGDPTGLTNGLFSIADEMNNLLFDGGNEKFGSTDGTNTLTFQSSGLAVGNDLLLALAWHDAENAMTMNLSKNGGSSWGAWVDGSYDLSFDVAALYNFFYQNVNRMNLVSSIVYDEMPDNNTGNLADAKEWIELNAGNKTTS